jgi:hypothetical protein
MILEYCPTCGTYIAPIAGPSDWSAAAIAAWTAEIRETCQHQPICTGPWVHAVKMIREAHDNEVKSHAQPSPSR